MVIKHLENKIRLVGIICTAFLAGCIIISVSSIWTARTNGDGRAEKGVCAGRKCTYTRNPHDDGRNTGRGGQEPRRNVPPLLFYSRTGRQIHPLYDGKSDVPGR